ncbi:HNH endonuclease [Aggregatilinea lenta]|uniref:HNH endonuclease n=1 Tax=Aggregatilinea lenta TaxID=913108 RepID=UPI000E5A9F72
MAKQVRERDGACVCCGRVEGLDAHHVDSYGAHGRDDPDRMVTLCRICHSVWHNGDATVRKAVEDYLDRLSNPIWITEFHPITYRPHVPPGFLHRKWV